MTNDPDRASLDDTDLELDALFATMKRDQAPADTESRLLQALAAGAVVGSAVGTGAAVGTGSVVAKVSLGSRAALLFQGSWWLKLGAIGVVCTSIALTTYSLVHPTASPSPPTRRLASSGHRALAALPAPSGSPASSAPIDNAPIPLDAPVAPVSPTPAGRESATQAAGPGSALSLALDPTPPRTPGRRESAPSQDLPPTPSPALVGSFGAPLGPGATGATGTPGASAPGATSARPESVPASSAPVAATSPTPPAIRVSDELQQEVSLLRGIAAHIDAGRCSQARLLIAQYRSQHDAGQLRGEVTVLEARCAGR